MDGSSNSTITEAVDIPIRFPCGKITPVTFYMTKLDSMCNAVLGYNWLVRYNPLIDWKSSKISFHAHSPFSEPTSVSTSVPEVVPDPILEPSPVPENGDSHPAPPISIISAAAFALISRQEGTQTFRLWLRRPDTSSSGIPEETLEIPENLPHLA